MNIIQIQDRLKGLPNEALVNYVEEPKGEVPIYLALGELQRRKGMRERFQASQTPPPSVSEQLVAENKPQQMGLRAMAPQGMMPPTEGVGAPQPQPQPQMDPRQLAASGIAANPQSAVGGPAMMAKGGIVGEFTNQAGRSGPVYEDGSKGFAWTGLVPALWGLGSRGVTTAGKFLGKRFGPSFKRHPTFPSMGGIASKTTPGYFRQPGAAMDTALASGLGYWALSGDPELEDKDKKVKKGKKTEKGDKKEKAKAKTIEDDIAKYRKLLGSDPSRARVDERLAKLDEKIAKREGSAGNMALIEAGLNMAAGQSPNALTNLATGATAGMKSYTAGQKDIDTLQKESLALDVAIGQAKRQEELTIIKFGIESEQARAAALQAQALINQKFNMSLALRQQPRPQDLLDARESLEGSRELEEFKASFVASYGEANLNTPQYKQAENQFIMNYVQNMFNTGGGGDTPLSAEDQSLLDKHI